MKKIFCFILLLFPYVPHAQNLEWARKIGNQNTLRRFDQRVGPSGCSYYSGNFDGIMDFDPGNGVYNLTALSNDAYIFKLDANGDFVWAKRICSVGIYGFGFVLDDAENIYLAGGFVGSSDFDPGIGIFTITSNGGADICVMKLDSSGDFQWAKQIGGVGDDYTYRIAINNSGDLCIAGSYSGTVDFDPSVGVSNLTGGGIFSLQLDSAGIFKWCKKLNASNTDNSVHSIAVDVDKNIFVSGDLDAELNISKLDSSGTILWQKPIDGTHGASGDNIFVATDYQGNLFAYGHFVTGGDFDLGTGVHTLTSGPWGSNFILKTDNNGNFIWAKWVDIGPGQAGAFGLDNNGDVYYTGFCGLGADLNPGPGDHFITIQPSGTTDNFLVKLNANGDFLFGMQLGGNGNENGQGFALGPNGEIFLTGSFQNTVDFDPGSGVYNLTASNQTSSQKDVYFLKLSSTLGVSEVNRQEPSVTIYPNPATGSFYVNSSVTISALQVTDMLGRIVYSAAPGKEQCAVTVSASPGIYQVIIYSGENKVVKKLVLE